MVLTRLIKDEEQSQYREVITVATALTENVVVIEQTELIAVMTLIDLLNPGDDDDLETVTAFLHKIANQIGSVEMAFPKIGNAKDRCLIIDPWLANTLNTFIEKIKMSKKSVSSSQNPYGMEYLNGGLFGMLVMFRIFLQGLANRFGI